MSARASQAAIYGRLKAQFAIPVLRYKTAVQIEQVCRALADGGLGVIEITVMNDEAFTAIEKLSDDSRFVIGAGTIRNLDAAVRAIDCGAQFLVSPGFEKESFKFALDSEVLMIPGVLTPTEIMTASSTGARVLKIFPAGSVGGANYIKMLRGPFPDLEWMPSGGVSLKELEAYWKAGAACVGLGSQLVPTDMVEQGRWADVSTSAKAYVNEVARFLRRAQ